MAKPTTVPDKLSFTQLEKFEGHMLINWLCSSFDENHFLYGLLSGSDMRVLAIQFCSHMMAAGVIHTLEEQHAATHIFKVSAS